MEMNEEENKEEEMILRDEFDREYVLLLQEIEVRLSKTARHDLIRITAWVSFYTNN